MKIKRILLSILLVLVFSINAGAYSIVRLGPEYFPEKAIGRPISNAQIYVGIPDLDPIIVGNQKQLYVQQESGVIVPVLQPIRTSAGGIPLYLGSPVTLLVAGEYSLKVLSSSGSQIYYVPNISISDSNYDYEVDALISYGNGINYTKATIDAALLAIGIVNPTTLLLRPGTWVIDADANYSAYSNVNFKIPKGSIFSVNALMTLTLPSPSNIIAQPNQKIKSGDGTLLFSNATGIAPVGWWGWATGAGAAQQTLNSTAWNAAIQSGAATVTLPSGEYYYNSVVTVDRAIKIKGSGGPHNNGMAGVSTTDLHYTGMATALHVPGGYQSVHMSDFMLSGTNAADIGIQYGNASLPTFGSLKNVCIRDFTKLNAYGLYIGKALEMIFESIQSRYNYNGIKITNVTTTNHFNTVMASNNTKWGWYIDGSFGSTFTNCIAETNGHEGIVIYGGLVQALNFYNLWLEDNYTPLTTPGMPQITIAGSAGDGSPNFINFYGGSMGDNVPIISSDYAKNIAIYNIHMKNYAAGFWVASSDTLNCSFVTALSTARRTDITNNHVNGVTVNFDAPQRGTFVANLDDDAAMSFTPRSTKGIFCLHSEDGADLAAIVTYNTDGARIQILGGLAQVEAASGILNGTTGTDGKLTISCFTDGKIYIENRRGFFIMFVYEVLLDK